MRVSYLYIIVLIGLLSCFQYACEEPAGVPVIDSISPIFGPEETLVTIQGENLANIQSMTFSGEPINFNTAYNADHALLFRIPTTVPLGPHEVVITTVGGNVVTNFRVTNEAPEIFELAPESGAPGDVITIRGENFYEPVSVYFFDSVEAEIVNLTLDSIQVRIPDGIEKGFVTVEANGGPAFSPKQFFTTSTILINDFDGNGVRAETNKWIFVGSLNENAFNAVRNLNPAPVEGNFLKLSGQDDLNIQWIGGAQNHAGFPGDDFETFGLTATANNILFELDVHNNGRDNTHIILIFNEKDGSPNDFTYDVHVDWEGWDRISVPLNRFKDLNDVTVDPTKIRVVKIHLIDEEQTRSTLEVNVDNLQFVQLL